MDHHVGEAQNDDVITQLCSSKSPGNAMRTRDYRALIA